MPTKAMPPSNRGFFALPAEEYFRRLEGTNMYVGKNGEYISTQDPVEEVIAVANLAIHELRKDKE